MGNQNGGEGRSSIFKNKSNKDKPELSPQERHSVSEVTPASRTFISTEPAKAKRVIHQSHGDTPVTPMTPNFGRKVPPKLEPTPEHDPSSEGDPNSSRSDQSANGKTDGSAGDGIQEETENNENQDGESEVQTSGKGRGDKIASALGESIDRKAITSVGRARNVEFAKKLRELEKQRKDEELSTLDSAELSRRREEKEQEEKHREQKDKHLSKLSSNFKTTGGSNVSALSPRSISPRNASRTPSRQISTSTSTSTAPLMTASDRKAVNRDD